MRRHQRWRQRRRRRSRRPILPRPMGRQRTRRNCRCRRRCRWNRRPSHRYRSHPWNRGRQRRQQRFRITRGQDHRRRGWRGGLPGNGHRWSQHSDRHDQRGQRCAIDGRRRQLSRSYHHHCNIRRWRRWRRWRWHRRVKHWVRRRLFEWSRSDWRYHDLRWHSTRQRDEQWKQRHLRSRSLRLVWRFLRRAGGRCWKFWRWHFGQCRLRGQRWTALWRRRWRRCLSSRVHERRGRQWWGRTRRGVHLVLAAKVVSDSHSADARA